jgi:hypothetical protein
VIEVVLNAFERCCIEGVTAVEISLRVDFPTPLDSLDVAAWTFAATDGVVRYSEAIFVSMPLNEGTTILPSAPTNERRLQEQDEHDA